MMNRPTRITLIGAAVVLLMALWITLAGAASRTKTLDVEKNFDLTCAVAASAEIATTREGTEERNTAFAVNVFFLGRLSGRDNETVWSAVIKGRVAELREKAKSAETYGLCLDFLRIQL